MRIPGKKPHTGKIEVKEYDELPETEASRKFKMELDNLNFDVNKLIKEAKLDKEIEGLENKTQINIKKDSPISKIDGIVAQPRKASDDPAHDAALKISGLATSVSSERRGSGYISGDDGTRGYASDVSTDNSEPSAHKSLFKVAIEVNVTNEKRRDSLDPFEKLIAAEKRIDSDKKEVETKQEDRTAEIQQNVDSQPPSADGKSVNEATEQKMKN